MKYTVKFIGPCNDEYEYELDNTALDHELACLEACEMFDNDSAGERFVDEGDAEFCIVTDENGISKTFECSSYYTKHFTADEDEFSITTVVIKNYCPKSVTVYIPDVDKIVEVESFDLPSFINEDSVDKEYFAYCNWKKKNVRFYNWKKKT